MVAAETLEKEYGITCEVIDLRTVDAGYDRETILKSLMQDRPHAWSPTRTAPSAASGRRWRPTSPRTGGTTLHGPIGRVHPKFTRVSYGPQGEKAIMPSPDSVVAEALRILS